MEQQIKDSVLIPGDADYFGFSQFDIERSVVVADNIAMDRIRRANREIIAAEKRIEASKQKELQNS